MGFPYTKIKFDETNLGNKFILKGVREDYKYEDGKRTDKQIGYKYDVMSLKLKADLTVKVPKMTDVTADYEEENEEELTMVSFDNIEGKWFCCKVKIICTSIQNYKSQYCFNSKEFC
ncbi:hypothetical protein BUY24_11165 [Staphylococcus cohnii]|nr:hypothetical protein BUY24_11165 [Staphylococcus cohnii]